MALVAARLNAAHAELVDVTRRLLDAERWAGGGIRSPEHWLVVHTGLSPSRAADGALTRYQFGADDGVDAPADDPTVPGTHAYASAKPELSMSYGDGRFQLRFSARADLGALVEQAVKEAKDALFGAENPKVTYADGLLEMARRALSAAGEGAGSPTTGSTCTCLRTAAGWVAVAPSRRRLRRSTHATASSSRCGRPRASRSTWAESSASCRTGPGGWSRTAIGGASSPAAQRPGSSRCTTSTPGPRAGRRTWSGWCRCARSITTATTAASSRSRGRPLSGSPRVRGA